MRKLLLLATLAATTVANANETKWTIVPIDPPLERESIESLSVENGIIVGTYVDTVSPEGATRIGTFSVNEKGHSVDRPDLKAPSPEKATEIKAAVVSSDWSYMAFNREDPNDHDNLAFTWTETGGMNQLPFDAVVAVGEDGWVLGYSGSKHGVGAASFRRPYLYKDGVSIDLYAMLGRESCGWSDLLPTGLTPQGWVVGIGSHKDKRGKKRGFAIMKVDAVPEPASVVGLAAGGIIILKRRRKA